MASRWPRLGRFALAPALVLCFLGTAAHAQNWRQELGEREDPRLVERGRVLLAQRCAACHALGRTGDSPRPDAPPLRTIGRNYPIETLEEALGEGLSTGHPDMPEFQFAPRDIPAVIAFLRSIQIP